jgi:hypothetical protein
MAENTCGARREGWQAGPAIGRHRIPCIRPEGHQEAHRDGLAQEWANTVPTQHSAPQNPAVATGREALTRAEALDFNTATMCDLAYQVGALREALCMALDHISGEDQRTHIARLDVWQALGTVDA